GVAQGDGAGGGGVFQVAAEAVRAGGGQVVDAGLVEPPAGGGQEGVDVAGDQAGAEEPGAGRAGAAAAAEPVRRQRGAGRGPGRADDGGFQAGERVAGV